jgi:ubiquinone/menaquinone biosynthesis C-methylase UbiE
MDSKNNQPEGNYFNKYESKNPMFRKLMDGFFSALKKCLSEIEYSRVYEAGCGEGKVSAFVSGLIPSLEIHGSDISEDCVRQAKDACPVGNFSVGSIYQLEVPSASFDLVIACEVLEHLEDPESALKELLRVTNKYLLISVPNEPIWCICNMLRGKYILHGGNTPGHIQHWGRRAFLKFAEKHCKVIMQESPFPWTMLLCEK